MNHEELMDYELPWTGKPFSAPEIAFDTETTSDDDLTTTIPEFVVMSVSDGERTAIVLPEQLGQFIDDHFKKTWVGWNTSFDWWVILNEMGDEGTWQSEAWWQVADSHLLDVMLLEQLVRLGQGEDSLFFPMGLKAAVARYLKEDLEKDSAVRLTYTRSMTEGTNWQDVPKRYWDYSARDALKTFQVYRHVRGLAESVAEAVPVRLKPAQTRTDPGLLSVNIQTKADIALSQITRNGFGVDKRLVQDVFDSLKNESLTLVSEIRARFPGLFKMSKQGDLQVTKTTGLPKQDLKALRAYLTDLAGKRELKPPQTDKSGETSSSSEWWTIHAGDDPFIQAWGRLTELAKQFQLVEKIRGKNEVHPRYHALVRTGRTSASDPGIQQIPKGPTFRRLFVPRPGHKLVIVDYSAIELRTLATVIEQRWGSSVLGSVLREGRDPHSFTASMVLKLPYEEVVEGIKVEKKLVKEHPDEPTPFIEARQAAKAINFGVPGGLGRAKLQVYAEANYGVKLTDKQAGELRTKLITEVYPELTRWLNDSLAERLAVTLGCTTQEVDRVLGCDTFPFGDPADHPVARVVRGDRNKKNGQPFSEWYVEQTWVGLESCIPKLGEVDGRQAWIADSIRSRRSGADLHDALFCVPCVTTTGRVRKRTFYGDYRNTQFQGLASDGAKVALWDLTRAGYKIVAFIHDEVVVEVPESQAEADRSVIEKIMVESFSSVMPTDIPIAVEGVVNERWVK